MSVSGHLVFERAKHTLRQQDWHGAVCMSAGSSRDSLYANHIPVQQQSGGVL